jgi:hypothetical protein
MSTLERHFSPRELSEAWGLSDTKIRRIFQNEPGVLLIGEPSRRVGRKLRRSYYIMRIPESVASRVYERLRKKPPFNGRPPQPAPHRWPPASGSSAVSPEP